MTRLQQDTQILRDLAQQYAELAAQPIQDERRRLWTVHNSLKPTRPLVLATYGMWNVWCREVFGDAAMQCQDPFYRRHERALRQAIFHSAIGDDFILEPWITQVAALGRSWGTLWGVPQGSTSPHLEGGAYRIDPPIKTWDDLAKLSMPDHVVDETATARSVERLQEAVGELLPIDVHRGPACLGFLMDISTDLARLRGLEQIMVDMYESPDRLHELLALMRDGILRCQEQAEAAGDMGLTCHANQAQPYCDELEPPRPNSGPRRRDQLWGYCAAQEFTLISPRMHEEFLLQYQLPILKRFALTAYGCCENLTHKIDMLRQIPNLRIIAVTPTADPAKCAEQIGRDYVISWRPNPTDMVCCGFNEDLIRSIISAGLEAMRGCHVHIHLKDIETVEGDPDRLRRWTEVVRSVADDYGP